MVWIVPSGDAAKLDFAAISDSAIVSGLIYLALRVYSGRSAAEILATEPDYIADIGLAKHLSPTRSNGLAALLAFIRDTAQRARVSDAGADTPATPSSPLRNRGFLQPDALPHLHDPVATRSSRSRSAGTSTRSPAIRCRSA